MTFIGHTMHYSSAACALSILLAIAFFQ